MIVVNFTAIIRINRRVVASITTIGMFWFARIKCVEKGVAPHWGANRSWCSFKPIIERTRREKVVGRDIFRNWLGRIARK